MSYHDEGDHLALGGGIDDINIEDDNDEGAEEEDNRELELELELEEKKLASLGGEIVSELKTSWGFDVGRVLLVSWNDGQVNALASFARKKIARSKEDASNEFNIAVDGEVEIENILLRY